MAILLHLHWQCIYSLSIGEYFQDVSRYNTYQLWDSMGMLCNEAAGCKISSVAILVGWDGAQWLGPTVSVLWPFWEVGWFDDPPSLLAFAS